MKTYISKVASNGVVKYFHSYIIISYFKTINRRRREVNVKLYIRVEHEVVVFFGQVCYESLVKIFYIGITIRCYFASLSIDRFVFLTRHSLRYLSLKLYISSMKSLCYKVYGIRFRSEIICSS